MKTALIQSFLFILIVNLLQAQIPQLVSAYKFPTITNQSSTNELTYIGLNYDETIYTSGYFYDDINTNLLGGTSIITTTPVNYASGFIANYDSDFNLINSRAKGEDIRFVSKWNNETIQMAGFYNAFSSIGELNNEEISLTPFLGSSEAYIGNYNTQGNLNWYKQISGFMAESVLLSDKYYYVGYCGVNPKIADRQDTTLLPGGAVQNGLAFIFDFEGNVLATQVLAFNGPGFNLSCDYSTQLDEFSISGKSFDSVDYSWEGNAPELIEQSGPTAFVASYTPQLELSSYFIITNQDNGGYDICDAVQVKYDENGNMYILVLLEQSNYTLKINGYEEDIAVTSQRQFMLFKLNQDKELVWSRKMSTQPFGGIPRDLQCDKNGYVHFSGSFRTTLEFEDEDYTLDGSQEAGFIARWSPEGDLIWAYSIEDGGRNDIRTMCFTPDNEMYIGGGFTSFSTDFDFTEEGTFDLGMSNGWDPFIAKYTIANPAADVFVEQGWQTTEVTEGGADDKIYVRLSHAPTAPVQVVVTPNAQLNLGNGAGNAITLTFAANESAVLQQVVNVSANDDSSVEGTHTGIISFDISSADGAFNALTESNVIVSITDNDVVGIEEQQKISFAISPNPVKDVLNVTLDGASINTVISVYDDSGRLVQTVSTRDSRHTINTSAFAVGKYSMVVQQGNKVASKNFLVNR
jgi:hypothetical protein